MKQLQNKMHEWFVYLWETRMDEKGRVRCFECGKLMYENTYKHLTTCYSHILSKLSYEKYKGEGWNVKIVHPDCHFLYEMYPEKAINQYNEYMKLKEKIKEEDD